MKSLFDKETLDETLARIGSLSPESTAVWGQMNVSQMMEHCSRALDWATGKDKPKRMLLGYLLGGLLKKQYYNDKPVAKNLPTAPKFQVTDTPDFALTKERFTALVKEFSEGGEAKCTRHPSAFFGHLTPAQHGKGTYKHIDHHLTQFGV
jgi:hypothetical protein